MSSAGSYGGGGGGGGVGNVKFLTGNTGGAVPPDLTGNINVVGSGDIAVDGNAGTNTLTISLTGGIATTYDADTGSATPVLGILNINGASGIQTTASGNTVVIETDGLVALNYDTDSGTATPSAGVLNIIGGTGITTSGSGDTVTITSTATGVTSITGDAGGALTGAITVTGGTSGAFYTGSGGNTLTTTFNYLDIPQTSTPGTTGVIKMAGSNIIAFYGGAGNFNMSMGFAAGNAATTGSNNIGYGHASLNQVTSGFANVAFGPLTLEFLTTGNTNVAMGLDAMQNATTASGNLAIGNQPMQNLLTGSTNVAIGSGAGSAYVGAESNNILIQNVGVAAESNQIRIGTQGSGTGQQNACNIAGIYGSTVGGTNSAVFIDNAGNLGTLGGGGGGVTSITGDTGGALTGNLFFTGGTSGQVFNGAGVTMTTTFHFLAMSDTDNPLTTGYLSIGGTPVLAMYGGVAQNNISVGATAGNAAMAGVGNTLMGENAGHALTSASTNTFIGAGAGQVATSSANNIAVGGSALSSLTTGNGSNCAVGLVALDALLTGARNVAIGTLAGSQYTSSESSNICILNAGVTGDSNTMRLGTDGSGTGQQNACYIAGGYGQSVGGTNAALFIDNTGKIGTVGGSSGGVSSITGDSGPALTGAVILTGGVSGLELLNSGGSTLTAKFQFIEMDDTTATTGYISLNGTKVLQCGGGVANNNIFLGEGTGNTTLSGTRNTAIGAGAMTSLTSATNSVAVGSLSCAALTTGTQNVGCGYETLQHATTTIQNTALGAQALQQITTGSGQNVAIGAASLSGLGTGTANIAIGYQAGINYASTEANNILLGNAGTASESGVIKIGTNATHTTCFVQGIAGVTVANSAIVLINTANGQLGTVASSRRFKENIDDMGVASRDIYKLRPVKFNFKGDFNQSYGLIAEDVEEVAPYLVSYDQEGLPATVKYHELPALLLNEIQRLKLKIDELEGKLNARVRP